MASVEHTLASGLGFFVEVGSFVGFGVMADTGTYATLNVIHGIGNGTRFATVARRDVDSAG